MKLAGTLKAATVDGAFFSHPGSSQSGQARAASGFTLIELMIVVVILSILALIAYPGYQGQVAKSRRSDAKAGVTELSLFMERYFTQNTTYVGATLPFTEVPRQGNTKFYDLAFPTGTLTATTYTIRATPKGGQAGDGFLELTQSGVRRWDADNSGTITGTENVWE